VSHCERDYLDRTACALRAEKWHIMASDDHQAECPLWGQKSRRPPTSKPSPLHPQEQTFQIQHYANSIYRSSSWVPVFLSTPLKPSAAIASASRSHFARWYMRAGWDDRPQCARCYASRIRLQRYLPMRSLSFPEARRELPR
jgi:hypothetical protein